MELGQSHLARTQSNVAFRQYANHARSYLSCTSLTKLASLNLPDWQTDISSVPQKSHYLLRLLRRFSSDSTAVTSTLFPPILFTVSIKSPSRCNLSTSSPPPMLLPLIRIFGTVFLPVMLASSLCNAGPRGCSFNSTTNGAGVMLYFKRRISFALRENGQ